MIPTGRLILLAGLLVIPMLLAVVDRNLADVALMANLALIAIAATDILISPRPKQLEVERQVSEVLSVGASNPARLILRNRSRHPLQVTLHDDPGPLCEIGRLPQTLVLPPWKEETASYVITPLRRGPSELRAVHLRFPTRWKLWTRHQVRSVSTSIRIYPDIRAVYRYELMARKNRLSEIGVRMQHMPGQGREFERLREYRYGDEVRQIDWKATARQGDLISREFNVERNQNIVILVDCGRFMRTETDGISYLDRALNASIMLSYIALGQGDNVSLLAFSDRIERFVRPVRGKPGVQAIVRSIYDIQTSSKTSDYSLALEYLTRVQRKRALVILMTFVTDELQLSVIGESLQLRSLPYLPMCVLLQDVGLRRMAESIPQTDLAAFHSAAAAQILAGQMHQVANLRESGVMMLDVAPDMLSERVINEYLQIKMRSLI